MSFKFNFGEGDEYPIVEKVSSAINDKLNNKNVENNAFGRVAKEILLEWQDVEGDTDVVKLQSKEELLTVCVKSVEEHLKILVAEGETTTKESEIAQAIERNSDLIPHVYEGGLTIWECSYDLVDYLSSLSIAFRGVRVLELGCGAALPGLYAMKHGAEVHFQDYNEEVIRFVTIPNVILNSEENADPSDVAKRGQFFAGDWTGIMDVLTTNIGNSDSKKYDIILTSETIYSKEYYRSLLDLMAAVLKPSGKIFLAAKTYYFGVGGGTREFQEMVNEEGIFQATVCKELKEGVKREILEMTFAKEKS